MAATGLSLLALKRSDWEGTFVEELSSWGVVLLYGGHAWARLGLRRRMAPLLAALLAVLVIPLESMLAVMAIAALLATCMRLGWQEFRHHPLGAAGFLTFSLPLPILLVVFILAGLPTSSPPSRDAIEGGLMLVIFGPTTVGAFLIAIGKGLHWRGELAGRPRAVSRREATGPMR